MKQNKNCVKKELTVSEAGKIGGNTTKQRYGMEHYKQIGRMGGNSNRQNAIDAAKYREMIAQKNKNNGE